MAMLKTKFTAISLFLFGKTKMNHKGPDFSYMNFILTMNLTLDDTACRFLRTAILTTGTFVFALIGFNQITYKKIGGGIDNQKNDNGLHGC